MAVVYYSQQDEYDLVNSGQDCMGWEVTDQAGNALGKVTEMLIDTDKDVVDSVLVDRKKRIPAADFALLDGRVVVRGVTHGEQPAVETEAGTTAAETHQPMQRAANAAHVAGVTREAKDDEISIPIIEEQLVVGKRAVEKGGARVRTTMTDEPVEEAVRLREENVTVERHKVDRAVDANTDAFKEGSFDITTRAEVPVVSKQARVVEEVVIDKEMTERTETVRDTVKRTDVRVDEIDAGGDAARRENG